MQLGEYNGELYSVMYGRLYIWDRVGSWVLVADAYDSMTTSAGLVVIGDAICTAVYKTSPARASVLCWRLGEPGWTEVTFITSTTGRLPRTIVEVGGQIRMGSSYNCSIMDINFDIVATLNQWTTPIYPIVYNGILMAICSDTTYAGLYNVIGSSLIRVGEVANTNREFLAGSWDVCNGILYTTWHGTTQVLHAWDGVTWSEIGPMQNTQPGLIMSYMDRLYYLSNDTSGPPSGNRGTLYKVNLGDASRTIVADPIFIDGVWVTGNSNSSLVFENKLYFLGSNMVLLRFANIRRSDTVVVDTIGFTSPDDSVWPGIGTWLDNV